jgi:hypothetical protein
MQQFTVDHKGTTYTFTVDDQDWETVSLHRWAVKLFKSKTRVSPYAYVRTTQGVVYLHRMIMGVADERKVDHRDRDTTNNQRSNLRVVTNRQSNRNRGKLHTEGHTSRFKGVHRDPKGRWRPQIRAGKIVSLGSYPDERTAAHAYDAASILLHGRHGLPNLRPPADDAPDDMPLDHIRLASQLYALTVSALPQLEVGNIGKTTEEAVGTQPADTPLDGGVKRGVKWPEDDQP